MNLNSFRRQSSYFATRIIFHSSPSLTRSPSLYYLMIIQLYIDHFAFICHDGKPTTASNRFDSQPLAMNEQMFLCRSFHLRYVMSHPYKTLNIYFPFDLYLVDSLVMPSDIFASTCQQFQGSFIHFVDELACLCFEILFNQKVAINADIEQQTQMKLPEWSHPSLRRIAQIKNRIVCNNKLVPE